MIKAELIQHMGSDLTVVNAARVSFDKESEWDTEEYHDVDELGPFQGWKMVLPEPDQRLIRYLAKHQHFTPFTHCQITLRETVPIFVARQRFKHVVGFTYNEVSRRYVDDTPEFYVPDVWRKRAENVKQGSSDEVVTELEHYDCRWQEDFTKHPSDVVREVLAHCVNLYDEMLEAGVAPEQARMVLPQSMMTSYYVTGSLMAFARAYKQRSDSHAQKEIQDLAAAWDRIIRPLFPHSWSALVD